MPLKTSEKTKKRAQLTRVALEAAECKQKAGEHKRDPGDRAHNRGYEQRFLLARRI